MSLSTVLVITIRLAEHHHRYHADIYDEFERRQGALPRTKLSNDFAHKPWPVHAGDVLQVLVTSEDGSQVLLEDKLVLGAEAVQPSASSSSRSRTSENKHFRVVINTPKTLPPYLRELELNLAKEPRCVAFCRELQVQNATQQLQRAQAQVDSWTRVLQSLQNS